MISNFINYIKYLNFLFICFISFKSFKDKNSNFFLNDNKFVYFPVILLTRIFLLSLISKIEQIYYKRNKLQFDLKQKEEFVNFKFSNNWFSGNAFNWYSLFDKLNFLKNKINILEIGSFEGQSTVFLLSKLKYSNIDCVDPWKNYKENLDDDFVKIEQNFDNNTLYYSDRVTKHKMSSKTFFDNKKNSDNIYDIIYIDGDHHFKNVYYDVDSSFKLLKKNGVLIIDDFIGYNFYRNNLNENPFGSIIVFLNKYKKNIKILKINTQLIISKL